MAVKCPRCDFENPEDTRFCGKCAAPLVASPSKQPTPAAPSRRGDTPSFTKTMRMPIHELTTGSTFAGRYQVIEELGRGGMGRVYKVLDTELDEKVALKLLRPEVAVDSEMVERFRNELKSARQVTHKNVCRMFDIGRAEGAPFITMEYVHGEDLKRLIRKIGLMPAGRTVSIARQIAEGLAEAHAHGIIHRDLKPQNIMVDEGGNVRIMDFGIARSLAKEGITGAGILIGTPEYMSPEQVEGNPVDARSDIYSLGVILYEMVTGRVPFEGDSPFAIGVKHKSEPPRDPLELNPAIPQDLGRLILRSLEKDREKRFQSATELLDELTQIEQALPATEQIVPKYKPRPSRQVTVTFDIKKVAVPALAAILAIAAALVLWLVVLKKHAVLPASGKPQLAVLYFRNNTGDEGLDIWRTALPELIIADLSQSRYIDVVSTDRIFSVLRGLNLVDAKAYASEDLKAVAEKTGATHILQGILTKAGTSFRVNTTLQDSALGKLLGSEMVQGEGEASFHTMIDELGRKIKAGLQLTSKEIASDIDRDVGKITTASPEAFKFYAQGQILHEAGDDKNAIPLFEKAVAIDPGFAMVYRSMAVAYGNLGFPAKSDLYHRKAMELVDRVSDRERWIIEGSYYSRSLKTYDKAIQAFTKVLELYPDDLYANNRLGVIYFHLEEWDKAAERFAVCARQRGSSYANYSNLAQTYRMMGKFDLAREVIEGYLRTAAPTGLAYYDLALIYLFEGKYDLALVETDKAFALAPSDIEIISLAGRIHMLKGDMAQAEAEFQKLWAETFRAGRPWMSGPLLPIYASQGKYQKTLDLIGQIGEQVKQKGEPSWFAPINLFSSWIYYSSGRPDDALKAADRAFKIAEAPASMWTKGLAYLGLKAPAQAQKIADELKALKSMELYHHLQGGIDLENKNYLRAIENLKAAIALLRPQDESSEWDGLYYDTLAKAYEGSGDLENARKTYEKIQALTSGRFKTGNLYALSFYRLGMIAEKRGDKAEARANYLKFLELWKDADKGLPEPADAQRRLAALQ